MNQWNLYYRKGRFAIGWMSRKNWIKNEIPRNWFISFYTGIHIKSIEITLFGGQIAYLIRSYR